jgi:hypothetical protein
MADSFNYTQSLREAVSPPTLSFSGAGDQYLGHPSDVELFLTEVGTKAERHTLGIAHGNLEDYDHISMLTSQNAIDDHFPQTLRWLNCH